MASSPSRGGRAVSALLSSARPSVCVQCVHSSRSKLPSPIPATAAAAARGPAAVLFLSRRAYSAAAAAAATSTSTASDLPLPQGSTSSSSTSSTSSSITAAPRTPPAYRLRAGLLLSRPPLLTREPTAFESAFYLYQKRLNERLAASFRKEVYFKRDTALAIDWRLQLRERYGTPARDIGVYAGGKGRRARARAWDDELTVTDPLAAELTDPARLRTRIVADADLRVSDDGVPLPEADRVRVDRPLPRTTAADAANDTTRLDRKLDRTLYLVVRGGDDVWAFPTADMENNEVLHETAARALEAAAGVNMNTWVVGRAPIAHLMRLTSPEDKAMATGGEKTFFLKGRIMAGQANLEGNALGVTAFQWLTKEELAAILPPYYFASVKNAMPERVLDEFLSHRPSDRKQVNTYDTTEKASSTKHFLEDKTLPPPPSPSLWDLLQQREQQCMNATATSTPQRTYPPATVEDVVDALAAAASEAGRVALCGTYGTKCRYYAGDWAFAEASAAIALATGTAAYAADAIVDYVSHENWLTHNGNKATQGAEIAYAALGDRDTRTRLPLATSVAGLCTWPFRAHLIAWTAWWYASLLGHARRPRHQHRHGRLGRCDGHAFKILSSFGHIIRQPYSLDVV